MSTESAEHPIAVAVDTSDPSDIATAVSTLARPVVAVREEMSVEELAMLLLERKLTCVPVVGARDEVIGFVSMTDIVRDHAMEAATAGRDAKKKARQALPSPESGFHLVDSPAPRVRDIMIPLVLTLDSRATIPQTAAVMAARGVHHLLLVSATGEVSGVVDARDVLRARARLHGACVADDAHEAWRRVCEGAL